MLIKNQTLVDPLQAELAVVLESLRITTISALDMRDIIFSLFISFFS